MSFFNAMFSVLMAAENLMNETQLIRDSTSAIGAACDAICTNATIIQLLIAVSILGNWCFVFVSVTGTNGTSAGRRRNE